MDNLENESTVQIKNSSLVTKFLVSIVLLALLAGAFFLGLQYAGNLSVAGNSDIDQSEKRADTGHAGTTVYFSPERNEIFSYSRNNIDYTKNVYDKYRGNQEKYAHVPTSSDVPLFEVTNPNSFLYNSTKLQNGEIVATLISNNTASVASARNNKVVMNESREKLKGASTVTNIEVAKQKKYRDLEFAFGFTDRLTLVFNPSTDLVEWVSIPDELGFLTVDTENSDGDRLVIRSRRCDACDDPVTNTIVYSRVLAEAKQLGQITNFDWEDEYEYRYKPYVQDEARINNDPECFDLAAFFCNVDSELVPWEYDDFYKN